MYLEATGDTKWFIDKVGLEYEDTIVDVALIEAFWLQPLLKIEPIDDDDTNNLSEYAKESLKKLNKNKTEGSFIGLINNLVSIEGLSYTFGDCMEMTPNSFISIWKEVDKYFERINEKLNKSSNKSSKSNNMSMETPKDYDM